MKKVAKTNRFGFRKITGFLFVYSSLIIMHATMVYASSGGGEHEGAGWKDWLWKIINFAVLVFILIKFLAKPMREYFQKRTEMIEKSLNEAREAKELAQKALQEVQEKLKLKDQEIERIVAAAKQSGETERDSLIEQGAQMSEKIKEQAKANIEMELKNAKAALRAEAAELAIKLAEKKLREELSEEDQLKLIEDSIKRLEG